MCFVVSRPDTVYLACMTNYSIKKCLSKLTMVWNPIRLLTGSNFTLFASHRIYAIPLSKGQFWFTLKVSETHSNVRWLVVLGLTALWDSKEREREERRDRWEKNVQTTPPAPTASAVGPCPTLIKIVGRPGTGTLPSTIAPPQVMSEYVHSDIGNLELSCVYAVWIDTNPNE